MQAQAISSPSILTYSPIWGASQMLKSFEHLCGVELELYILHSMTFVLHEFLLCPQSPDVIAVPS